MSQGMGNDVVHSSSPQKMDRLAETKRIDREEHRRLHFMITEALRTAVAYSEKARADDPIEEIIERDNHNIKTLPDVFQRTLIYLNALYEDACQKEATNDVLAEILVRNATTPIQQHTPQVASMTKPMGATMKTKKPAAKNRRKK
jgi:hypothetical protein